MYPNDQDELNAIGEADKVRGVLENTKEETELFDEKNKQDKNKHKHRVFIGSLYFLWAIALIVISIRVYHFLAPVQYHWLDVQQVQALDKLLFSGTIGTVLGRYGNRLFS